MSTTQYWTCTKFAMYFFHQINRAHLCKICRCGGWKWIGSTSWQRCVELCAFQASLRGFGTKSLYKDKKSLIRIEIPKLGCFDPQSCLWCTWWCGDFGKWFLHVFSWGLSLSPIQSLPVITLPCWATTHQQNCAWKTRRQNCHDSLQLTCVQRSTVHQGTHVCLYIQLFLSTVHNLSFKPPH